MVGVQAASRNSSAPSPAAAQRKLQRLESVAALGLKTQGPRRMILDDDDALPPPPPPTVAGQGQPRQELGQEGEARSVSLCKILTCKCKKSGKAAFCTRHRRIMDQDEEREKTPEEEEIFRKIKADPEKLTEEIDRRVEEQPSLGVVRGFRGAPMDYAAVKARHYTKTAVRDETVVAKFDRIAFDCHFKNNRAWTAEKCDCEWKKYENDPLVGRDHRGEGGSLRLHVQIGDMIIGSREKGQEKAFEESSKQLKRLTPEAADKHIEALGTGHKYFGDKFFSDSAGMTFSRSSADAAFGMTDPEAALLPSPAKKVRNSESSGAGSPPGLDAERFCDLASAMKKATTSLADWFSDESLRMKAQADKALQAMSW